MLALYLRVPRFYDVVPHAPASPPDSSSLERAMARVRAELRVVEVASQELLDLYGAPLALIGPDQIVAWRGASDVDAESTTRIVTGT